MESDGEWEIVSVDKVKSVDDLHWTQPPQTPPPSQSQKDDISSPPQIVNIEQSVDFEHKEDVSPSPNEQSQNEQKQNEVNPSENAVEDEPDRGLTRRTSSFHGFIP